MNWRDNIFTQTDQIRDLLSQSKTIAVLGIKPETHSYQPAFYVPQYMHNAGFRIIPVPVYYPEVTEILGETVYRKLIDVAGLYYYVSLPFVAVLLLAIAGSVLYGFPAIGRIPVQLMVVLVLGTVGTIYKMARSVFIKVKPQDPPRARGSARTLETDGRGGK